MDDERSGNPWIAWCTAIIVLLGMYVTAYAILVEAGPSWVDFGDGHSFDAIATYRYGGEFSKAFFMPAELTDRLVRLSMWHVYIGF